MPGAPPVRPGRTITGMSAILLPHHDDGSVDWDGLAGHVERTARAGLTDIPCNTTWLLVPPNPKEFDRALLTFLSRAYFGTKSILVSTAGFSRLIVVTFRTSGPPVFSILTIRVIFEQNFHYGNL